MLKSRKPLPPKIPVPEQVTEDEVEEDDQEYEEDGETETDQIKKAVTKEPASQKVTLQEIVDAIEGHLERAAQLLQYLKQ